MVRGFADALSVAPLTYSLRRGDLDFVVFCFAKPEGAETFCQYFGGKRQQNGATVMKPIALPRR